MICGLAFIGDIHGFDMEKSVLCVFQRGYANRNGDLVERVQSLKLVTIQGFISIVRLTTHEAARI